MKTALEVLAKAAEKHLGDHPVSLSVAQLVDDPSEEGLRSTERVFERLPGEDKVRVCLIAEAEARKARAERDAGGEEGRSKVNASRADLSSVGSMEDLL